MITIQQVELLATNNMFDLISTKSVEKIVCLCTQHERDDLICSLSKMKMTDETKCKRFMKPIYINSSLEFLIKLFTNPEFVPEDVSPFDLLSPEELTSVSGEMKTGVKIITLVSKISDPRYMNIILGTLLALSIINKVLAIALSMFHAELFRSDIPKVLRYICQPRVVATHNQELGFILTTCLNFTFNKPFLHSLLNIDSETGVGYDFPAKIREIYKDKPNFNQYIKEIFNEVIVPMSRRNISVEPLNEVEENFFVNFLLTFSDITKEGCNLGPFKFKKLSADLIQHILKQDVCPCIKSYLIIDIPRMICTIDELELRSILLGNYNMISKTELFFILLCMAKTEDPRVLDLMKKVGKDNRFCEPTLMTNILLLCLSLFDSERSIQIVRAAGRNMGEEAICGPFINFNGNTYVKGRLRHLGMIAPEAFTRLVQNANPEQECAECEENEISPAIQFRCGNISCSDCVMEMLDANFSCQCGNNHIVEIDFPSLFRCETGIPRHRFIH